MGKLILAVFLLIVGVISLRGAIDTLSGTHALVFGIISAISFLAAALLLGRGFRKAFPKGGRPMLLK